MHINIKCNDYIYKSFNKEAYTINRQSIWFLAGLITFDYGYYNFVQIVKKCS